MCRWANELKPLAAPQHAGLWEPQRHPHDCSSCCSGFRVSVNKTFFRCSQVSVCSSFCTISPVFLLHLTEQCFSASFSAERSVYIFFFMTWPSSGVIVLSQMHACIHRFKKKKPFRKQEKSFLSQIYKNGASAKSL